jgi:gliding motility-associated-like protein
MKSNKTVARNLLFIFFLLSLLLPSLKAQTIRVNDILDAESSFSPEELIENVLVSGSCANISNITSVVNGNPTDLTTKSYGYFKRLPGSTFPFEEGIILTTGNAFSTTNGSSNLSNPSTGVSDADLNQIIDPNTAFTDATVFEFDFTPSSDTINFRYVMASEEYEINYPCLYSDSFAFLLREAGTTTYENIAIVPETTTPVSVTSVHPGVDLNGNVIGCAPQNEDYFEGYKLGDTYFNGRTTILNATATVIPNKKYHIKLVIADANDGQIGSDVDSLFDSAVFLEAGSFNLGLDLGDDFLKANNTAVCGNEFNLTANIAATSYQWLKDGVIIPGATNQTYTANLGDGTYSCNITDNNGCTGNDEVVLEFVTAPLVNPLISVFEICDIDGDLSENFNLTAKETEILDGQSPLNLEVQYFSDTNYINQILNPVGYVNTNSFETIYVRVLNKESSLCYTDGSFNIQITNLPIPTQPTDYQICDDGSDGDDTNGFVQNFILSSKDNEILGSLDPTQYTISYHTSLIGAQTNNSTDVINKFNPYSNTSVNTQQVFVRIENIDNTDCNATDISFNLIVDLLPVVITGVEINYCIVTGDPNPTVDLTQAENQISPTTNASFEYFKDLAGTDLILDPVSYPPVGNVLQSVYVKVISDQGCARDLVELVLNIGETPNNSFNDLVAEECDDFLDQDGNDTAGMNDDTDNITNFSLDLTAIIAAINPPINTEVFFYESTSDRNSNSNNIQDLTNYRNNPTNIDITVVPDGIRFPIYYKILSTINNDCEGIGQFYLQINQVPTVNPYGDLELCDDLDDGDGFNGIVQTFNLESQTAAILGTQDPSDFTVTYHNSAADALSGNAPIATPAMYENSIPNLETIFVRVENNLSGCFTAQTSFDIIVNPLPVANFVEDLEVCDDNTDGSAQNGFSQSFDLELQTAGILGTQDPAQFTVTYHASLADAQAGVLPLGSPFSNSVPFSQIIYARVYNSLTGCANGIYNFNAIVNPEPTTENASNLSYCDDDLDGDDTNGFVQNIDLDSQITEILGPLQDPDDFNVTFHETQTDATDGTDALSSPYTNTTANQQTIYVRVENKDTQCVNDDFTFDVIVNPLPEFTVTSPQIVCLSGPDLTIFVENPAAVYDYVWTDPSGNEIIGSQITISSGGLYTVTATTTNGTGCTRTREILVNESSVATITDADVTIVDDSDNNSITIDPTNLGIGDYQYALIDEDGIQTAFQDLPFFENLQGGFYTIVVQDKNGCRPNATLLVSVIEFPKFFTPNNDGINDTWAIKGANSTFFPSAQINIFNRFGKIVAQIDIDTQGWDGTYGGKILASDDYWFSIMLVDRNGALRERKGNFSLLRR